QGTGVASAGPQMLSVGSVAGVATLAGDIRIATDSGTLKLANNVCGGVAGFDCGAAAHNNVALLAGINGTGDAIEGGGIVDAVGLIVDAGVKLDGTTGTAGKVVFDGANM